jgi:hypothetical protein
MKAPHAAITAGLMLAACAQSAIAQEFEPYESRTPQIHDGQGGERKTVNGVDFWMRGEPPRRYQFLGSITDERHKTGLWGLISMAGFEKDIAKTCKDAGGDAVILDTMSDEVTAVTTDSFGSGNVTVSGAGNSASGSGNWFGGGIASPVKHQHARFLVIKYLPDAPPAGAAPAGGAAQPAPPVTPAANP